ncbi:hypothetical protein DPMN_178210 [Dreissena polymorpha]|uniref:C2H2-type domain-containing protein n=1 Tax=Dreissena polymorpha TaxID=45954 RepID=A0A9D4IMD8_DREPO|nr:hypothetical protein DPMN_178210 [Dreissena polymorpha]
MEKQEKNIVGIISPFDCTRAFKRLRSGIVYVCAQDRRKVNRIAGDSNAHRIKDILPDDIAVKCLPISDENMVVCSNEDALLSHFCSRHIKQPETGKESKIKLIGSPMELQTFPPTMWIKMFGLMILGRMCGQGGLHYIMMQLCIQQHFLCLLLLRTILSYVVIETQDLSIRCKWISCKEDFHSIGQQDAHIISHVVQEKCCRWEETVPKS